MAWTIKLSDEALIDLKKMDHQEQELILSYLQERINGCSNPRVYGEPLKPDFPEIWRYRAGKYRIFCELVEDAVLVYVVKIDHRPSVYIR